MFAVDRGARSPAANDEYRELDDRRSDGHGAEDVSIPPLTVIPPILPDTLDTPGPPIMASLDIDTVVDGIGAPVEVWRCGA